jgi:hypothetical protein
MSSHLDLPVREIQLEREALFARLVEAFVHRDFPVFDEAVREDVVARLPGSSRLAGTHNGREAFGQFVVGMRHVLWSSDKAPTYVHEGDQITVGYSTLVMGPKHQVEMILRIKMGFDDDGKVATCFVEPEDVGLFDHVANSTLPYVLHLDSN